MMQTHQHDARIGSASIVLDAPIPAEVFDLWLDTLVRLRGSDLLRVKGIVHLEDVPTPFVFHGVQHLFDPPVPCATGQRTTSSPASSSSPAI
nr:GTP-binding protein [Sulfitobacter faviae]